METFLFMTILAMLVIRHHKFYRPEEKDGKFFAQALF